MVKALTKKQVATSVKSLARGWSISPAGTTLVRIFAFPNYLAGFMFVTKISIHAEAMNHHPEVLLAYSSVKISISNHETKALATIDFNLACTIDTLYLLSTANAKPRRLRK